MNPIKCLNDTCYLLSLSELDTHWDSTTNNLKKEFTFGVDNDPADQPSSNFVQRYVLSMTTELLEAQETYSSSFCGEHSKRNYVERAHAEEIVCYQSMDHFIICLYMDTPLLAQRNISV